MTKAIKALALVAALFGAPALAGTFVDGFTTGPVNTTTKWQAAEDSRPVAPPYFTFASGDLVLGDSGYKRINTIPMFKPGRGNEVHALARAKLNGQYQKFGFNVNGLNGAWGAYFDTVEGSPNTLQVTVLNGAGVAVVHDTLNVSWGQYHTLKVTWALSYYWSWTGTTFVKVYTNKLSFFVDGVQRYATQLPQSSYPVAYKPVGIWNDRPATMKVDYTFVTNRKVSLNFAQLTNITNELNDGDDYVFADAFNPQAVVTRMIQKDGVIYGNEIYSDDSSPQMLGLFMLNEGADLTFASPAFSWNKYAPKSGYVDFNVSQPFGGTFGPGAILAGVLFDDVQLAPSGVLNFHTQVLFTRYGNEKKLDYNVHFR